MGLASLSVRQLLFFVTCFGVGIHSHRHGGFFYSPYVCEFSFFMFFSPLHFWQFLDWPRLIRFYIHILTFEFLTTCLVITFFFFFPSHELCQSEVLFGADDVVLVIELSREGPCM